MKSKFTAFTSALVLGTAASVGFGADESDIRAELDTLRAQMQDQQAEIERLRSQSGDTWLNERRSEEVRALVHDVLSDAETRASFQQGGLTSGHRDGHFFIGSDDGNFLLNVSGQVQARYVYNRRRDSVGGIQVVEDPFDPGEFIVEDVPGVENRETHGGEIRRAKIGFHGHIVDPTMTYMVRGNFNPTRGFSIPEAELTGQDLFLGERSTFELEDAWFGFEFADGWQLRVGQMKAPFLREELVYSKHQLAVERSVTSTLFSAGYSQGAELNYTAGMFRAAVMAHQGSNSANSGFNRSARDGAVDFAISARGELLVAGEFDQFDDFATWSDDTFGLLVGAAVNYENAAGGAVFQANDVLRWTIDASVEVPEAAGFNAFAAVIGNHPQSRNATLPIGATDFDHVDQWGLVGQAGIFLVPDTLDVFGRWEYLDLMNRDRAGFAYDDPAGVANFTRKAHTLTIGSNYYIHGHAAKATLDLVWHLDPMPIAAPGSGILQSGMRDQFALRGQFQFLF